MPQTFLSLKDFLDDLKVYLIRESREVLNKLETSDLDRPSLCGLTEGDLFCFSEEAEFFGDFTNANYYLEV